MRPSKRNELLLSGGEWATIGAGHQSVSFEYEALAQALADVLDGRARSLHSALRLAAERTGAEQVGRAAHNWAVREVRAVGRAGAELSASDPGLVLAGVLIELADLHRQAHLECVQKIRPRTKGGRPKGASRGPRPGGRQPEYGVTEEVLRAWGAQRASAGRPPMSIGDFREQARNTLRAHAIPATDEAVNKLADSWARRSRKIRRRQTS